MELEVDHWKDHMLPQVFLEIMIPFSVSLFEKTLLIKVLTLYSGALIVRGRVCLGSLCFVKDLQQNLVWLLCA